MEQIVVGYDGSEPSMDAVRWAIGAAALRGAQVLVVESWREPIIGGTPLIDAWQDPEGTTRRLHREMDAFVEAVRREHPTVDVATTVLGERADHALIEAAGDASMLVVGSRGRGGFASLLLGSVSRRVVGHAAGPVVVVRNAGRHGPVVVGVDGSAPSRAALAWAAEEAAIRGLPVRAVLAWTDLVPTGEHGPEPLRAGYTAGDADRTLRRIVGEVLGDGATVPVELVVSAHQPGRALVEAAEDASLLVVGAGSPGDTRVDLGSVAWQVLYHAPCTIAVVRDSGA